MFVIPGLTRNPVSSAWIAAPRLKHAGTCFSEMTWCPLTDELLSCVLCLVKFLLTSHRCICLKSLYEDSSLLYPRG